MALTDFLNLFLKNASPESLLFDSLESYLLDYYLYDLYDYVSYKYIKPFFPLHIQLRSTKHCPFLNENQSNNIMYLEYLKF